MSAPGQNESVRLAIEVAVRLGLVFIIVVWCLQILQPFISLVAWGMVIAISAYHPFTALRDVLGGRRKLASTVLAVAGLTLVSLPAWLFSESLISSIQNFHDSTLSASFEIKPPPESVQQWPLVGQRLYTAWSTASVNLESLLEAHSTQLQGIARAGLSKAANAVLGILLFVASVFIAAIFLNHAERARAGALRFCRRVAGEGGEAMLDLAVATVRSVTIGVLGVAFIQALLGGVGMLAVGIPAVGVWTLLIMILAIAQLPPLLVLLPMIIYVFSSESTTVAVLFTVWSVLVSLSDAVLKPLLLGRGVKVPMLVILLGAIGGLIHSGIMGLFIGSVILALGYTMFLSWLARDDEVTAGSEASPPD